MVKELHKRSAHVDVPVDKVFDYVKDPLHFWEAWAEQWRRHMAVAEVKMAPDAGGGTTIRLMGRRLLIIHMEWVMTRKEFVPNERTVDHANTDGVWTFTFEPDETGTTLSGALGGSGRVPFVGEVMDRFSWEGDRGLDNLLGNLKKAIET